MPQRQEENATKRKALLAELSRKIGAPAPHSEQTSNYKDRLEDGLRALRRPGLHDIAGEGLLDEEEAILPALFAFSLLAQWKISAAFISSRQNIHAPGLRALGIDPGTLLFVETRNRSDSLWACEEVLRLGGLGAALLEIGPLSLTESRRLQLAAEKSAMPALLLRCWRLGAEARQGASAACAAMTRWRVTPEPDGSLSLDLWRNKNGPPQTWRAALHEGILHEISLPLAQPFSDRSMAPQQRRA
ncbi:MAG TPA: hypothetical protein VHL08_07620 [Dongiaceae bacterium]|jgi:protein ImuA|nr:hypothetical protein [Dongiaceae bacterium]